MRTSTLIVKIVLLLLVLVLLPLLLSACKPVQAPAAAAPATPAAPAAGSTKTNPKDGAVYVYVPAGPFIMGSAADDKDASDAEMPQSTVNTDGFWIAQTDVTNAQYARCVADKGCEALRSSQWQDPKYADYPLVTVTWQQASDYARWAGGRLPTEAEWEKACRGTDGRVYPWGSDSPSKELVGSVFKGDLMPVGSSPEGASPFGALDMTGYVYQWTSSKHQDYPYQADDGREAAGGDEKRILRGSNPMDGVSGARCANRTWSATGPGDITIFRGFRVASSGF